MSLWGDIPAKDGAFITPKATPKAWPPAAGAVSPDLALRSSEEERCGFLHPIWKGD